MALGIYEVIVVDPGTGTQSTVEIEASSPEEARAAIGELGHVESVRLLKVVQSRSAPRMTTQPRVQTIEQTSKEWKVLQFFGGLGLVIGFTLLVIVFSSAGQASPDSAWVGGLGLLSIGLIFVGVIMYIVGRIGAWWNNG